MSYPLPDQPSGQYPSRGSREPEYGAPASDYPPPPGGEEEARPRPYSHARTPSTGPGVTLPSIAPTMPNISSSYDSNQHQSQPHQQQQPSQPPPQQHYGPPPPSASAYGPPPPQQHDPRVYQYPPPPPAHQAPNVSYGQPYPHPQAYPPTAIQYQQSAPRQRTAIACRYCRRRKIRCSGFENHPNGQCSNCARFHQECIFTPVSSQTQAFVPAHAVYPNMRNMPVGPGQAMVYAGGPPGTQQLYGAHGQPLGTIQTGPPQPGAPPHAYYQGQGPPQMPQQAQHPQPPHPQHYSQQQPQLQQQPQPHPQPSPTGSYGSFSEEGGAASRKRPKTEPHLANAPPPMPGQAITGREDGGQRRAPAVNDDVRPAPPATPTVAVASTSNPPESVISPSSNVGPASQQQTPMAEPRVLPSRTSPSDRSGGPMSIGSLMDKEALVQDVSKQSGAGSDN